MANINDITEKLAKTKVDNELIEENDDELSFAGRGLKLNTEESAIDVIQAINECKSLKTLRLDGNTIGVDAAKGIAKALEKHSEFQRALWSDIFTGRFKTEIPQALRFLSLGITMANAHLVELDLSDNAFGPAGVEAVTELLKSPSGFSLQKLRFNNNGLGSGGGKILSKALLDCHKACDEAGLKFALKMFIAGRNRLENPGAIALAQAFKVIGTLEEVVMPQNGIYHEGISALADAFAANKNLKILNLNDNTFTHVGAKAMAKALSFMQNLEVINFGDCLIRTEGAKAFANALEQGQPHLKELHLNNNEIGKEGAWVIAESLNNKKSLVKLEFDGNQFGKEGIEKLRNLLNSSKIDEILGSLSDDEGEEEEEEEEETEDDNEDDNSDEEEEEEEAEEEEADENKENTQSNNVPQKIIHSDSEKQSTTVSQFLSVPSAAKLIHLGSDRAELIIKELRDDVQDYDKVMETIMKLACLLVDDDETINKAIYECIDAVLSIVFKFPDVNLSLISNHILVYLGLIKSEDKVNIPNNLAGPLTALQHVVAQSYFPKYPREILQAFLSRPIKALDPYMQQRNHLLQALYQA